MADNFTVLDSTGATKTLRTNEISGAHLSVVKPAFGPLGSESFLTLGQQTQSASVSVTVASDQPQANLVTLGDTTKAVQVSVVPHPSSGSSVYRNIDLGATGQVVKGSPGTVQGYFFANKAATWNYLKFYDKATAATNSDTPLLTMPIPPTSAGNMGFPKDIKFSAGISVRATTGIADNDNVSPATNDFTLNALYV